jgi:hypothetical protein
MKKKFLGIPMGVAIAIIVILVLGVGVLAANVFVFTPASVHVTVNVANGGGGTGNETYTIHLYKDTALTTPLADTDTLAFTGTNTTATLYFPTSDAPTLTNITLIPSAGTIPGSILAVVGTATGSYTPITITFVPDGNVGSYGGTLTFSGS